MGFIDKEPVEEMVKKHLPEGTPLFERIVDVCFHAGYYEMDIQELCDSIKNFAHESSIK